MIVPINEHLLISPIKHEDFVEGGTSFDEIGEVIAVASNIPNVPIGCKVYFDSYLVARYPSGDPDKPYWLVKYNDVRAIENG